MESPSTEPEAPGVTDAREVKRAIDYPYDILYHDNDESLSLEEQVKYMKNRYNMLTAYVRQLQNEEHLMNAAFMDWIHTIPGKWPKDLLLISTSLRSWRIAWVHEYVDEKFLFQLTETQKKDLVMSLDGYCVQEDFDSILSRLGRRQRKHILFQFAIAFLVKTAVEKFFQHPFWYVELMQEGDEPGEDVGWQGVSKQGALLEELLERFTGGAVLMTILFSCPLNVLQERRKARCKSLAASILADRAFQCLLVPTDDVANREDHLAECLACPAEIAVRMLSQNPVLKFYTLYDLPSRFHHESESVEADADHAVYYEDSRLDGHRILFIHFPFVFRVHNDTQQDEVIVVRRAAAVMEEYCSVDEEGNPREK